MEYTLTISQKAIADNFPNLDIKDAAIIDFLTRFSHSTGIQKKFSKVGAKTLVYYWFDYKHIASENPLLRLDSESIRKRIRNLCRLGIFVAHSENQGGQVFFAFGDNYEKTHKHRAENPEVSQNIGQNIPKHRAENPELLPKHRAKYPDNQKNHLTIKTIEQEKEAASPFPLPENENQTLKAEKETPPPNSAQPPPLIPPFTPTGETIEPQPAKVIRLYEPELPSVTIVDSVPATYETNRGKPANRYEPHVHPENENIFSHFTEPERAREFWGEWLRYKHDEKRQRYKTPQTELAALRRLWDYSHGETTKVGEIIETAIANLWQGFFKPKEEKRFTNKAVENHATLASIVLESRRAAFGHGDGGEMGTH